VVSRVECYAGYKADERPTAFWLGDERYEVRAVLDRWYGPGSTWFKLRADDGNIYILRHDVAPAGENLWTLAAFRRETGPAGSDAGGPV
jgi:hypothetical protein